MPIIRTIMSKANNFFTRSVMLTLVILAVFVIIIFAKESSPVAPIIYLTKEGYSPAGVKVKKGTEVTFVNKTKKDMWPASDLHPDHSIYPELDPQKAISPGERWIFKFEKTGTYRFHDHINPAYRGIVVVTEEDVPESKGPITEETFDSCKNKEDIDEKRNCYTALLQDSILNVGPDNTFKLIGNLRDQDPHFAADCHTVVHSLGEISYWKYSEDKRLPKTGAISFCGFGFLHGFMQEVGHHSRNFVEEAGTICKHFGGLDYGKYETTVDPLDQCYHGAGHGMAFFYFPEFGSDFGSVIERGAKDCRKLSDDGAKVSNCIYGMFGGIASAYSGGHGYKFPVNEKDPLIFCKSQEDDLKEPCLDSMVPTLGVFYDNDFRLLAKEYDGFPEEFLSQPFFAIGDLASKWVSLGKVKESEILTVCGIRSGAKRLSCVKGYTQGLVRNGSRDISPKNAVDICKSALLPPPERAECASGVLSEMKLIYPEDSEKLNEYAEEN